MNRPAGSQVTQIVFWYIKQIYIQGYTDVDRVSRVQFLLSPTTGDSGRGGVVAGVGPNYGFRC